MPYYLGDYYQGDPGLFSRFSFKKLFRAAGKVVKPLAAIAAPLIPGGQLLTGLLGGGVKGLAREAVQTAAPFMPLAEALFEAGGGLPAGARAMAGGTPGLVAEASQARLTGRHRRVRYVRARRRRRRY